MKITSPAVFWLALGVELASWELLIWRPHALWYALALNLGASFGLSYFLSFKDWPAKIRLGDRLGLMVFNASIFYWLLWLDFGLIKYFLPLIMALMLAYLLRAEGAAARRVGGLESLRLVIFLGGMFFSASIAFGLVTVLGWPLWLVVLIFTGAFSLLAWPAIFYWPLGGERLLFGYLAMGLLAAESLAVLLWLPFTEMTLGLMLTIIVLASYDLLKYFIQPELIIRRVIVKKILVYVFFLTLVMTSATWR